MVLNINHDTFFISSGHPDFKTDLTPKSITGPVSHEKRVSTRTKYENKKGKMKRLLNHVRSKEDLSE